MDLASRVFYPLLALATLAALGWGTATAGPQGLAFALFASLTLGGGLMVVFERSIVRSAFSLMATLLGVAGLFLLLEADFLAMAQILIYVGGILVIILFGVMLAPPDLEERKLPRLGASLALVGAGVGWLAMRVARTANWFEAERVDTEGYTNAERVGMGFLRADQYVVAFELAAVVLTVALVAAVYIARRKRADLQPEGEGELG
jgi:NADH-quinone oxidoreductase subunit J